MKNKKQIQAGIVVFLVIILSINIIFAPDTETKKLSDEEKEKYLDKIGISLERGENGLKLEDFEIDSSKNVFTIKKSALEKTVYLNNIKKNIILIIDMPEGGRLQGDLEIKDLQLKKGVVAARQDFNYKSGNFVFPKKSKVKIKDGKIILEDVELEKGSKIGGISFEGKIQGYDSEKNTLVFKKGTSLTIEGITFSPKSDESLEFDFSEDYSKMAPGFDYRWAMNTNGKEVSVSKDGEYLGRLNGIIRFAPNDERFIIGGDFIEGNPAVTAPAGTISSYPTVFVNKKETEISVISPTLISPNGKFTESSIDMIVYNGDLVVSPLSESINDIKIKANDGDYENVIVRKIPLSSNGQMAPKSPSEESSRSAKVRVSLEGVDEMEEPYEVVLDFSRDMPKVQGNLANLNTNIGHMFTEGKETLPWIVYNGEVIDKEVIGTVTKGDPLESFAKISDSELKKLFLKSADFYELDKTDFLESLGKYIGKDEELQGALIDGLVLSGGSTTQGSNFAIMKGLFELTQDSLENQKRIAEDIFSGTTEIDGFKLRDLIELTKDNLEVQKLLLIKYSGIIPGYQSKEILEVIKDHPDYQEMRVALLKKSDGVIGIDEFQKSSREEKIKIIEQSSFFTAGSMTQALEAVKDDKELQLLITEKIKEGRHLYLASRDRVGTVLGLIDSLRENPEAQKKVLEGYKRDGRVWDSKIFREYVSQLDPEVTSRVLGYSKDYLLTSLYSKEVGFNAERMAVIYGNEEFIQQTSGMGYTERWSVALSVSERLEQEGKTLTQDNIVEASEEIVEYKESSSFKEILGPGIETFIPVTHNEKWLDKKADENAPLSYRFQEDMAIELARDAGVPEEAIYKGLKGPEKKGDILTYIGEYSTGPTTILFEGHGGPEHIWLGGGEVGKERSNNMNDPQAISYVELGDALLQREGIGNSLSNVNIMVDACYSADFARNLYSYLYQKGAKEFPTVMTETSRGQVGYSDSDGIVVPSYTGSKETLKLYSPYMAGLYKTKENGKPLTLGDVFKSEKYYFNLEDGAVFVPTKKGIVPIGSTSDSIKPVEEKKTTPKDALVPAVIQIGWVEEEMEELFV